MNVEGDIFENLFFALKMVYNYNENETLEERIEEEISKEIISDTLLPYHPNILHVVHKFVDEIDNANLPDFSLEEFVGEKKSGFIVSIYCTQNLKQYIDIELNQKKAVISNTLLLLFLNDILDGICHLHKHFIVHRDLKPDNIFITPLNSLIIADFGEMYNGSERKSFEVQYFEDGFTKGGSPYYLPPEILDTKPGNGVYLDYSKSDIFSLGLIIYEILQPRKKESFINESNKRKDSEYIELDSTSSVFEIRDLVRKMLYCDPKKRIDCYLCSEFVKNLLKKEQINDINKYAQKCFTDPLIKKNLNFKKGKSLQIIDSISGKKYSVDCEAYKNNVERSEKENDNLGTKYTSKMSFDDLKKIAIRGYPYIYFSFSNMAVTKNFFIDMKCFKCNKYQRIISTRPLDYGFWEENDRTIVFISGSDLDENLFKEVTTGIDKFKGVINSFLHPSRIIRIYPEVKVDDLIGDIQHVKTYSQNPNTYEIYKGRNAKVAQKFLKDKSVNLSFYYVIVETPEGNFGKDIKGMYKE